MIPDYHFHTHFSTDSEADPKEYIEKAIFLGMKEVCFTDHLDLDYPLDEKGREQFKLDADRYYDTLLSLREDYAGRIAVRIGVEMGMNPDFVTANREFISRKPFDFVIGSTHTVNYIDPYYPEFWQDRSIKDGLMDYYEACLANVVDDNDFDVFGHLDYIRRYVPDKSYVYCDDDFYDITEEILRRIIAKNKGIELNTRGLHSGVTGFLPMITLLQRYYDLGGRIVTVGSDAHYNKDFAYAFKTATEILLSIGFTQVTTFAGRVPSFMPIS